MNILLTLLDLLLPPSCAICEQGNKPLCQKCYQQLCFINANWNLTQLLNLPAELVKVYAACEYEDLIKTMIMKIKYQGLYRYCQVGGELMFQQYGDQLKLDSPQILVPVPLAPSRKRWRGYNQAHLLAHHLGKKVGIPVNQNLLERSTFFGSQTKKSRLQRQQQPNPFASKEFNCQHVAIVDDVITTGSTLQNCAQALKKSCPSVRISACVLAASISAQVDSSLSDE